MYSLIELLNSWPSEIIVLLEFILTLAVMLGLLRYYGKLGIYSYVIVALLCANIQALKGGQFIFFPHPVALGTLLFGTISLAFDILTEYFGKPAALTGIQLGFVAMCLFTLLMLLTVGIHPLVTNDLSNDAQRLVENHIHLKALFMPMPGILLASLLAYLVSQYLDVKIFYYLRRKTHHHWLWLRTLIATGLAAFIDTVVFSVLAWRWLNPNPVSWQTLIFIYILSTYPLRLLCCFSLMPFIYMARYFVPKSKQ